VLVQASFQTWPLPGLIRGRKRLPDLLLLQLWFFTILEWDRVPGSFNDGSKRHNADSRLTNRRVDSPAVYQRRRYLASMNRRVLPPFPALTFSGPTNISQRQRLFAGSGLSGGSASLSLLTHPTGSCEKGIRNESNTFCSPPVRVSFPNCRSERHRAQSATADAARVADR
jgi:hypothetical protein